MTFDLPQNGTQPPPDDNRKPDGDNGDGNKKKPILDSRDEPKPGDKIYNLIDNYRFLRGSNYIFPDNYKINNVLLPSGIYQNNNFVSQQSDPTTDINLIASKDNKGPDSVNKKPLTPDPNNASANLYSVVEDTETKARRIVITGNGLFAGNSKTNTDSYLFVKDGVTTIVRPGKNGGKTETFNICYNKVFAQTLFLGATVKSFNASMGWGSEASRLTVELVVDDCKYPDQIDFNGDKVPTPGEGKGNAYIQSAGIYDKQRIALLDSPEAFKKDELGNSLIPGKVFYMPYESKIQSFYWYDRDPGFYADIGADSLDIIGIPAQFKYDDFEFSGIITSWERKNSEAGILQYTVTLESPSKLLQNVGVILDDYSGSIHQISRTDDQNNRSIYKGQPSFANDGVLGFPSEKGSSQEFYGGLIREQSIPNLVNVYGFLEDGGGGSSTNFGGSLRNSNGIPAYMVISALTYLLDRPLIYDDNGQQRQDAWRIFRYSPYGRIVGPKTLKKQEPHLSPFKNDGTIDIRYKMGLACFPGNNLVFRSGSFTGVTPYSLDLNDFFFNGYSVLTSEYRIDSKSSNVLQILQDTADAHGYEMVVSMYMVAEGNFLYPRIKVGLITKQITPQEGAVKNFIDYIQNNNTYISSTTVGEEHNSTGNTRTMLIGGKQRRIFQTKFIKYALNQNTLRWNPYTQTFLDSTAPLHNTKDYRFADLHNPRNSNLGYGNKRGSNNIIDVLGRVDRNHPEYLYSTVPWGGLAFRMNYQDPVSIPIIGTVPPAFDATAFGQICPYFGLDPFTRMARHVEYNDYYGQFFVSINGLEFAKYTGFSVPGFVQISENEIRAAMKGYDSFVAYISGLANTLYPYAHTHKFDLYNKLLFPIVGYSPLVFNAGAVNANKVGGVQKVNGLDTVPVSATSSTLTDPRLVNVLNKIHLYLQDIGNQYYGKEFMVGIPRPQYYIDYNSHFGAIGRLPGGDLYSSLNGTKEIKTAYTPVDSGWEEAGTTIDDSLMVGTASTNVFQNDDGTINPILGYNATPRYNRSRQFETLLTRFSNNVAKNAFLYNWYKFDLWRKSNYTATVPPLDSIFWEQSLIISEPNSITINYPAIVADPFFDPSTGQRKFPPICYKTYLKASVESDYVWAPAPTGDGRALKFIVKTSGAYLNPGSLHELSISAAVADYIRPFWPAIPGLRNPISDRLDAMISSSPYYLYSGAGLSTNNLLYGNTQNKPNQNVSLAPKAAIPAFAAIPFESNVSVYGPWINSPDMYVDSIYPYSSTLLAKKAKLENLFGGTKVINESDLVPWNHGGMVNLDMYAILRVTADNSYQQKGETGQLTYAGVPFLNLANELKATSFAFRGPIINNVQTQINNNGPTTTYTFRTYTKKFTLFNKEASELLKNQAKESFKRTKEIRQKFERIRNDLMAINQSKMIFPNYDLTLSKLRSASPSTILVGESRPYVSPISLLNPGAVGNFPEKVNPDDPNEVPIYWSTNSSVQRTNVALYNIGEVAQEFEDNYANKSFMSLDGLFSPVSFYPTIAGGSSSFKPYFETGCPNCGGIRRVTVHDNQGKATSLPCQLCSRDIAGTEDAPTYNILPPFILSNQSDSSILAGSNPTEIKDRISVLLDSITMRKRINYVNLNPIIMPVGEFRNEYAQQNDYTSHHIEYVGRSQVPPRGDLSILNNKTTLGFDEDQSQVADADYNSRVFDWTIGKQATTSWTQKNYRFLGLRGPLVMSGWGFDTAGYPVPNASGEPLKVDENGMPYRMRASYDPQSDKPWSPDFRGPIIGKNQLWDANKKEWTAPYPEPNFMRGWGLRPDLWPSGPVDLRWDAARKVWTSPKPYPNVYVQLETDLVPPFPARGFLDAVDKDSPLPGGLRRTVFVRDSSETYGAPRGAKILCFYDEGSGFYEPLARSPIIARGIINAGINATIFTDFSAGFNPVTGQPNAPGQITVNFANPLSFTLTTGAVGLFMFVRTEWVLTSINITC